MRRTVAARAFALFTANTSRTSRVGGQRTTTGARPRTARRSRPASLLHRQRFVDQLLAVRHFLRELGVGALLRDLEPLVILGRRQRDDLDVVLLEHLDHLVVEA